MTDDKKTSLLTNAQHIRVECVKLAYRHDRDAATILERAKAMETYVTGTTEQSVDTDGQAEPDSPI